MATASRRLLAPSLAGVAGVVLAHGVDYVLVHPHGADRAHVLHATGHAYWPAAVVLGLVGGISALLAAALRGGRRGLGRRVGPMAGGRQVLALAGFQTVLFAAVEILERLITGSPLQGLVSRPEFVLGVLLQLLVVVVVHQILAGVESVTESLAARLRTGGGPARGPSAPAVPPGALTGRLANLSVRPRGPPSPAR